MSQSGKKSGGAAKNIVMVLFLLGAGGFIYLQIQKRAVIQQENQAMEHYNAGEYDKALELYDGLHKVAKSADKKRLASMIAKCYVGKTEDSSLSYKKQLDLMRKAYQCDPSSITNPAFLKKLEAESK
ncbi:MAG: hypothetical protein KAI66_04305 [Lentisphaeria bacterium]|nr:hypothetical protein [Lentisphaeria bacterium]